MTAPKPVLDQQLRPNQLQGDRQLAEMSFASSMAEERSRDPGREVLVMTVDLGQGRKDKLIVHENDAPEELAASFARKHGLNERLCSALTASIKSNLVEMQYEEQKASESERKESSAVTPREESAQGKGEGSNVKIVSGVGENIGERLYIKGMQHKGVADLHVLRARHQQEEATQRELTFAPKISRQPQAPRSADDLFCLQSQATKRELELRRREQLQNQASECTFAPCVNPKSEEIEKKKSREGVARFEVLYKHAEVRKAKAEQETEEFLKSNYPFKPVLEAEQSQEMESQSAHTEKLYSSRRAVEAQLARERMRLMGKFDPQTGRELYKPKTGRGPTLPRDKKVPIGEYLHACQPSKPEPVMPSPSVKDYTVSKPKTEKIYEKLKQGRFRELFEALKSPQEAVLSAEEATVEKLSPEVGAVLRPLLQELQLMGETLDFEEFSLSMDNLWKVLSPLDKGVLLKKQIESEGSPPVKAVQKRAQTAETSLYDRAMLHKRALAERLKREKEQREHQQVSECSFRPMITPYNPGKMEIDPLADIFPKTEDEGELIPRIKAGMSWMR